LIINNILFYNAIQGTLKVKWHPAA